MPAPAPVKEMASQKKPEDAKKAAACVPSAEKKGHCGGCK